MPADPEADPPRQAVLVSFKLPDVAWGSPEHFVDQDGLEERLMAAVGQAGVGEFDGIGRGLGSLDVYRYGLYGRSVDRLRDAVEPVPRSFPARPGSYAVKRYGGPGSPEVRIDLTRP